MVSSSSYACSFFNLNHSTFLFWYLWRWTMLLDFLAKSGVSTTKIAKVDIISAVCFWHLTAVCVYECLYVWKRWSIMGQCFIPRRTTTCWASWGIPMEHRSLSNQHGHLLSLLLLLHRWKRKSCYIISFPVIKTNTFLTLKRQKKLLPLLCVCVFLTFGWISSSQSSSRQMMR